MGNAKTACRIRDRNEIAGGRCHRVFDPTESSGFFLIEALRSASRQQVEFAKRGMGVKVAADTSRRQDRSCRESAHREQTMETAEAATCAVTPGADHLGNAEAALPQTGPGHS